MIFQIHRRLFKINKTFQRSKLKLWVWIVHQQGNKNCNNHKRMYKKYLFNIIRLQQKYSSFDTIPLSFCKYYKTVFAVAMYWGSCGPWKPQELIYLSEKNCFLFTWRKSLALCCTKRCIFLHLACTSTFWLPPISNSFHFIRIYSYRFL
jgi:hypothetical protein